MKSVMGVVGVLFSLIVSGSSFAQQDKKGAVTYRPAISGEFARGLTLLVLHSVVEG